jgi:hypothetical protein
LTARRLSATCPSSKTVVGAVLPDSAAKWRPTTAQDHRQDPARIRALLADRDAADLHLRRRPAPQAHHLERDLLPRPGVGRAQESPLAARQGHEPRGRAPGRDDGQQGRHTLPAGAHHEAMSTGCRRAAHAHRERGAPAIVDAKVDAALT